MYEISHKMQNDFIYWQSHVSTRCLAKRLHLYHVFITSFDLPQTGHLTLIICRINASYIFSAFICMEKELVQYDISFGLSPPRVLSSSRVSLIAGT